MSGATYLIDISKSVVVSRVLFIVSTLLSISHLFIDGGVFLYVMYFITAIVSLMSFLIVKDDVVKTDALYHFYTGKHMSGYRSVFRALLLGIITVLALICFSTFPYDFVYDRKTFCLFVFPVLIGFVSTVCSANWAVELLNLSLFTIFNRVVTLQIYVTRWNDTRLGERIGPDWVHNGIVDIFPMLFKDNTFYDLLFMVANLFCVYSMGRYKRLLYFPAGSFMILLRMILYCVTLIPCRYYDPVMEVCSDNMFSGHVSLLALASFYCSGYEFIVPTALYFFSGMHYTSDILVAICMAKLFYYFSKAFERYLTIVVYDLIPTSMHVQCSCEGCIGGLPALRALEAQLGFSLGIDQEEDILIERSDFSSYMEPESDLSDSEEV